jgi:hypothetical protein
MDILTQLLGPEMAAGVRAEQEKTRKKLEQMRANILAKGGDSAKLKFCDLALQDCNSALPEKED